MLRDENRNVFTIKPRAKPPNVIDHFFLADSPIQQGHIGAVKMESLSTNKVLSRK